MTVCDCCEMILINGLFADEMGAKCSTALKKFNEVIAELGPLIKAGQVNITSEEGADKARAYGVSGDELKTSDCKLDIVLANYDEKGDAEDWQHFTGNFAAALWCSARLVLLSYFAIMFIEPPARKIKLYSPLHSKCKGESCMPDVWCIMFLAGDISVKDLQKFALEAFPSFVTRITAATMQHFLGPDPTVPCVILFTDKDATPPVFAALSVNLRKYKYKFADAHSSDAALMRQFNIKKVGHLLLLSMKNKL